MKWSLVAQGNAIGMPLATAISEAISDNLYDRLDVAVAYATLQGVKALEDVVGQIGEGSRWVVGLDDGITQPAALEYLLTLPGSEVRLASLAPRRRFHPKLFCLWSSGDETRCVSAVGSNNMTFNGLYRNGETSVVLIGETAGEVVALRQQWKAMWELGEAASQSLLDAYKVNYEAARRSRKTIQDLGISPPEHESDGDADNNPETAPMEGLWLEAGTASAGGRDLEFPRDAMVFFNLEGSPSHRTFETSDGKSFNLTFTRRDDNQMWRLLLSKDAISSGSGRPSLRTLAGENRSDLALVFTKSRLPTLYRLRFVTIGSPEHQTLIQQSRETGKLRSTSGARGRLYGFL